MHSRNSTRANAAQIARYYYEQNRTIKEIAATIGKSPQTVSRLLSLGQRQSWWRLTVDSDLQTDDFNQVNEELTEQLRRKTCLFDAVVVKACEVDRAYSTDHLDKSDLARQQAFGASDSLHRQLGSAAAPYVASCLNHDFTIALASGRGVMYTVLALEKLSQMQSRLKNLRNPRVLSLSGGMRVSPWSEWLSVDLDADTAAFQMANNVLGVPLGQSAYITGPVSDEDPKRYLQNLQQHVGEERRIDIAIVGLGVLNSAHHFFRFRGPQTEPIQEELRALEVMQKEKEDDVVLESIAEVVHQLFWVGDAPIPEGVDELLKSINEKIVAVGEETLKHTRQVILVAGGRQKLLGLRALCRDERLESPIPVEVTTLVTDEWTAEKILAD